MDTEEHMLINMVVTGWGVWRVRRSFFFNGGPSSHREGDLAEILGDDWARDKARRTNRTQSLWFRCFQWSFLRRIQTVCRGAEPIEPDVG